MRPPPPDQPPNTAARGSAAVFYFSQEDAQLPREQIAALIASWLRMAGYCRGDGVDVMAAARAIGINQANLRQYLAGETSPTIDTLERVAGAIGWRVGLVFEPADKAAKKRRRKKAAG